MWSRGGGRKIRIFCGHGHHLWKPPISIRVRRPSIDGFQFSLVPKWEGALDEVGIPVHLKEEDNNRAAAAEEETMFFVAPRVMSEFAASVAPVVVLRLRSFSSVLRSSFLLRLARHCAAPVQRRRRSKPSVSHGRSCDFCCSAMPIMQSSCLLGCARTWA